MDAALGLQRQESGSRSIPYIGHPHGMPALQTQDLRVPDRLHSASSQTPRSRTVCVWRGVLYCTNKAQGNAELEPHSPLSSDSSQQRWSRRWPLLRLQNNQAATPLRFITNQRDQRGGEARAAALGGPAPDVRGRGRAQTSFSLQSHGSCAPVPGAVPDSVSG